MADSEAFGWQVAAEVHKRRLGEAKRKACWGAARSTTGRSTPCTCCPWASWAPYEGCPPLAGAGQVRPLLLGLRAQARRLGEPAAGGREDDPRKVLKDAVGYVTNNRDKLDYPEYRRLGLPISSAPVESAIE